MRQALELAQQALYTASPNPRVGCVIEDAGGQVIGRGFTQPPGQAHAEIMAMRDARAQGFELKGATAWVTLEPCSHHGRTGPCCDALIEAGVARVVAAVQDPNPQVAGQGFARLRAAGVKVCVGVMAREAREINAGFFSRMQRGRPWLRLKVAVSLDGRTALPDGRSQWITSAAARVDAHAWRARACAIVTGTGTVLRDHPALNVRLVQTPRQPHLAVVDGRLRTPPDAALFAAPRQVWIYTATRCAQRETALAARGAEVVFMPDARDPQQVDLEAMLRDLAARGVNELHAEGGARLNGALVRQRLVDEYLVYMAPRLLGAGLPLAEMGTLPDLQQAEALEFTEAVRIGPDLRILARPSGGFLSTVNAAPDEG